MSSTVLCGLLVLSSLATMAAATGKVVELTDENFDTETSKGIWMIKVYAPWCSHCKQLEPLWQAFAEEGAREGILINGVNERAMMARLRVTAFPSIYLLRGGKTYEYQGERSVAAFRNFALSPDRAAKALPFHRAPNSVVGRVIGRLYSLPRLGVRVYRLLHDDHGLSDTAIVLGFLAIPVAVGGVLICALDAMYVRRAKDEFAQEHEHQE